VSARTGLLHLRRTARRWRRCASRAPARLCSRPARCRSVAPMAASSILHMSGLRMSRGPSRFSGGSTPAEC
jgi:hypothetical protein